MLALENGAEQSSSSTSTSNNRRRDVGLITPIGQDTTGNFIYKPEDQAIIDEIMSSGGCVNVKKGTITLVPCRGNDDKDEVGKRPMPGSTWSIHEKLSVAVKTRSCIVPMILASLGVIVIVVVTTAVLVGSQNGRDGGSSIHNATGLDGSHPSLAPPGELPTPAPTINTLFCGRTFEDASRNCLQECPSGLDAECGEDGHACFSNVVSCNKKQNDGVSTSNYCGFSFDDASRNCFQECPNGVNTDCITRGHACFANVKSCTVGNSSKDKVHKSSYCGFSFDDASKNCAEPCPSGLSTDCSTEGHGCFADVVSCQASPSPSFPFLRDTSSPTYFVRSLSPTISNIFPLTPAPSPGTDTPSTPLTSFSFRFLPSPSDYRTSP